MMSIFIRALHYAAQAHANQRRKYTNEPYINHCIEVAHILMEYGIDSVEMLSAAVLHDVVEDTPVTIEEVRLVFGAKIAEMVSDLTDVSRPSDGNREIRKAIDREHTAKASIRAKTIKLADLISNTRTIAQFDHSFAKVYLAEKALLLPLLANAQQGLWLAAKKSYDKALLHVQTEALQEALRPK